MTNRSLAEIVLRQRPATLPIDATVLDAVRVMRDKRIGAIMVTGDEGRLVGLFTGRDAVSRVLAEALEPAMTRLGAVMTPRPDTLDPGAHAIDALRGMQDGGYRHMPVVHGTHIVGIVSSGDFEGLERARLDEETGFWEVL
jgi:CBS domain-containing protein